MTGSTNIHWTDDNELLSKFVLRQLTRSEEQELAAHLRQCEQCHFAVVSESRIYMGAKFRGRSAIKERLKARIAKAEHEGSAHRPGNQIPWMRVASLAAVLVIIVAVGVYNEWFSIRYQDESVHSEQPTAEKVSPQTHAGENQKEVTEKGMNERQPPQIEKKDLSDMSRSKDFRANDQGKVGSIRGENFRLRTEHPRRPGVSEPATVEGTDKEEIAESFAGASPTTTESFWVEGHVMTSEGAAYDGMRDQVSARVKKQAYARTQNESTQIEFRQRPDDNIAAPLMIVLNQKPSSALPPFQQSKQAQTGSVQTLMEGRGRSIQMTLYLDSPVPNEELNTSTLEAIGEDSLILNFSNQRIGYRLPPELSEKVNTKGRQVK